LFRIFFKDTSGNLIEIDRLVFGLLDRDQSFGSATDDPADAGAVLRAPTPLVANTPAASDPQAGRGAWFVGQVPVWPILSGLRPAGGTARIRAYVSWDAAWRGESVPAVYLHWGFGDQPADLPYRETMEPVQGEHFETSLDRLTGTIRYIVEVVTPEGSSLWHSTAGVTQTPPPIEAAHALNFDADAPELVVNEVGVLPIRGPAGADGLGARTYVEIRNAGDEPVSLEGMYLSLDNGGDPWPPRATTTFLLDAAALAGQDLVMEPDGYRVIWLDGGAAGAPSLLERARGCTATLYDALDRGNGGIDGLNVPALIGWHQAGAFARTPDNEAGEAVEPTPGEPNPGTARLFINEIFLWVAGESPWVELYNAGTAPAEITGLVLGNDRQDFTVYRVGGGDPVLIDPRGFALIWVAGGGETGDLACDVTFNVTRDTVYLGNLDSVRYGYPGTWPVPPTGRSMGRKPDGGEELFPLAPTPGSTNEPSGVLFIRGDCNEDGVVDLSPVGQNADYAVLDAYLRGEAIQIQCLDRLDINDSGTLNVSDRIAFLSKIINADPPQVPPPFPLPGLDPTDDDLRCE
jgi:hypothetical protein